MSQVNHNYKSMKYPKLQEGTRSEVQQFRKRKGIKTSYGCHSGDLAKVKVVIVSKTGYSVNLVNNSSDFILFHLTIVN